MEQNDDLQKLYRHTPPGVRFGAMPRHRLRRPEMPTTAVAAGDLVNHSPTGFGWGYGGSGPAQLALALLADALGSDDRAIRLHHDFEFKVVAAWPEGERWWITAEQIAAVVKVIEQENAQAVKDNQQLHGREAAAASSTGSLPTGGPDAA